EDMYKKTHKTFVNVKELDRVMCGKYRPGHFKGVCTVVLKLINISVPDIAYFGLKDYQQFLIIKTMIKDLNLEVAVKGCPIIRDKDGLALSSRNKYLSLKERQNATVLYKALNLAAGRVKEGKSSIKDIKKEAISLINSNPFVKKIDYFDLRDSESLKSVKTLKEKTPAGRNKLLIASALWFGSTRLIDNILI
ncbi:MAG: pantoate--beta-alanine ligase, partial [Actinobacteria bacterium]|nr:pantoate--beta-alanine ligase [Actinomycetota bacterium]